MGTGTGHWAPEEVTGHGPLGLVASHRVWAPLFGHAVSQVGVLSWNHPWACYWASLGAGFLSGVIAHDDVWADATGNVHN